MPLYLYKARDENGQKKDGTIFCNNESEAIEQLGKSKFYIVTITEQKERAIKDDKAADGFDFFANRIKKTDIIILTRQIAAMSTSGIPITTILKSLAEQIKQKRLRNIIYDVHANIEEGKNLSEALALHPQVFSPFYINMVRMGEASGNLDEVMHRIVKIEEDEMDIITKIKAATTYPVILLAVAVCVISFLLIFILPKFVGIFQTYEAKLPMTTIVLLNASLFFKKYWVFALMLLAGLVVWLAYSVKRPEGKRVLDNFVLKIPIFGTLILRINIGRFARSVSGLIASGITLIEALTIVGDTTSNSVLKESFIRIRKEIAEGKSMAGTMRETGLFPSIVVQMVAAGESTGKLDQMLMDLSRFYDMEVEGAIKSMTIMLEPLLLIFMGGAVAFIALSVLLPIFNLIKIFKQ